MYRSVVGPVDIRQRWDRHTFEPVMKESVSVRILFISAFYPPHEVGGWEQLVRDVNERLQARGHTTHVLTSVHGVGHETREPGVDRLLTLESDLYHYRPRQFLGHKSRLRRNLTHVRETIDRFRPDVVFVHVMFNLSRGIPWMAEQLCPGRVVYYVANDWPHVDDPHVAYWQDSAQNPVLSVAKQLIAPIPLRILSQEQEKFSLQFERVLCVSNAVKKDLAVNAGIPRQNMSVVYNGVETDLFYPRPVSPPEEESTLIKQAESVKLLCAGSLVSHKGVHTVIEAISLLAANEDAPNLTIVGAGHPDYERRLQQMVRDNHLEHLVHFTGRIPREQMPEVLRQHDILLFPSIWEEPLARMMQEAMASGLAVIGTLTGGTGELLVEGETGLTFAPEDAAMLARRIDELVRDPQLRHKLAAAGRQKVLACFDIRRMVDEIETQLQAVVPEPSNIPSL